MVLTLAKCPQSCHAGGWLACLVFPTYIIRFDQPSLGCEASSSSTSSSSTSSTSSSSSNSSSSDSSSNSKKEGHRSSSSSKLSMYIISRCNAKLGAKRILYFRHCEGDGMGVM